MVERLTTLAVVKLEPVVLVDAAVAGNRQMVIGIHPVIKQVDRRPRGRGRRDRVVRNRRFRTGRQEETRRQRDGEGQNNRIWRGSGAVRDDGHKT